MKRYLLLIVLAYFSIQSASAQLRRSDKSTITYEEYYDDPYAINKLFIHFQPIYGELFVTNVNAGFGLQAEYYLKDKFDFRLHTRKAYTRATDFSRDVARKNSDVDNKPNVYNYYEFGATYHIVDKEEDTETKVILYSKRYEGKEWAAKVPEHIKVPSKVRKIYGARLGGLIFDSATDLNRAMAKQGVVLTDAENNPLDPSARVYGNIATSAIYVGGSMSWIKNFAIKPDKGYGVLVNDLIFTTYLDFIFAPSVAVEDIFMDGIWYSSDPIETTNFGVRAGMDGKFNRELGWGYGAELGFRPSVKTRGFYALVKISFPIYSTNMEHGKEAFGK